MNACFEIKNQNGSPENQIVHRKAKPALERRVAVVDESIIARTAFVTSSHTSLDRSRCSRARALGIIGVDVVSFERRCMKRKRV
jgi:hypothetical protein